LKPDLTRWLIVALGAGLPIPYAFHLPGDSSSYVAVDLLVWPVLVGILILISVKEWARLRHDRVARLLVAFVAVSAISVPFGVIVYHRLGGALSFAYQVAILLNFVVGYLVLREVGDVDLLIRSFVASIGSIALALSIYLLPAGVLQSAHFFHNDPALRALVYGWPNGFAVLLAVAFVMGLYVISTATTRLMRGAYVVLAIGLGVCAILTFSKTGWVALAVALWILWLRYWSFRRQLLVVAGLVVVGVVLVVSTDESFHKQVFTMATLQERLLFVVAALHYVNPLVLVAGSGSQSVEMLLASHAHEQLIPGVTVSSLSTHDEFLEVLVKTGLIGLAIFVAALTLVLMRIRRVATSADDRTTRVFRYWYAAGWAVIISLFAGEELHYWLVSALFWMMAGATVHRLAALEVEPTGTLGASQRAPHIVAGALSIVAHVSRTARGGTPLRARFGPGDAGLPR
jgi:O-antigen ligase